MATYIAALTHGIFSYSTVEQRTPSNGFPVDIVNDTWFTNDYAKYPPDEVRNIPSGYAGATTQRGVYNPFSSTYAAAICPGVVDPWINQIYFIPQTLEVGNIVKPTEFKVSLVNGFYYNQGPYSITRENNKDIVDPFQAPFFSGFYEKTYTITVNPGEQLKIDALYTLTLNDCTAKLRLTGSRGKAFLYRYNAPLVEQLEWLTQVFTAYSYEENRVPARLLPRRTLQADYSLLGDDATGMEAYLYTHFLTAYKVPFFPVEQEIAEIAKGTKAISCQTTGRGFAVGDVAFLMDNAGSEPIEITGVERGGITLKDVVLRDYTNAKLVPALTCFIDGSAQRTDSHARFADFSLTFRTELLDVPVPAKNWLQYNGLDVCEWPLYLEGGAYNRELSRPYILLDNGTSPVQIVHSRPYTTQSQSVKIYTQTHLEYVDALAFVYARQGMVNPFWASTKRQDFVPVTDYAESSMFLDVAGYVFGENYNFSGTMRNRLRIEFANEYGGGSVAFIRLTGAEKQGKNTRLFLEAPLSSGAISIEGFLRISFVSLYRLASDIVTVRHYSAEYREIEFDIEEVAE